MMVLPASTMDRLDQTIHVLQQLQRLLPISATLADVAEHLACVEAEFGEDALLEDVIQHLVGEHLAAQIELRAAAQTRSRVKQEVAA